MKRRIFLCTSIALLLAAGTAFASPTLREGSQGNEVRVLQQALQNAGYKIKSADGIFGKDTERAVAEFQRDHKIKITGIVTNATWRALKNLPAKSTWGINVPPPADNGKQPLAPNGKPILPASKVSDVIKTAKSYIGTPYVFGGTTPKGFDCSGLIWWTYKQHGLRIPRVTADQAKAGHKVAAAHARPGDIVVFRTDSSPRGLHTGIYAGGDSFIHSPSAGKKVSMASMKSPYWRDRLVSVRRILP